MSFPVPPWWFASIVANVTIMVIEALNRSAGFSSFPRALMVTGPLILLAQWGLFYAWRDAPSMLMAWAFFTVGNTLFRLASSHFVVGEALSWYTLAGVSLMFAGAAVMKGGN